MYICIYVYMYICIYVYMYIYSNFSLQFTIMRLSFLMLYEMCCHFSLITHT